MVQLLYKYHHIEFKPVRRIVLNGKQTADEPYHTSLSIVDRITRTLRDRAFTLGADEITPPLIGDLSEQYNHAPHDTLSKYAGFEVSPHDVQNEPELEYFICRRIAQENAVIRQAPGFSLKVGTKVKVFNELHRHDKRRSVVREEVFEVIGIEANAVKVRGMSSGVELVMPRTKITPIGT
jgi:hypothetical protein